MELGIYHEFPVLPGRSQAECFAAGFDIVDASEEYGLDVMWLAELHFDKRRALAASPLVLGTAIAARTERLLRALADGVIALAARQSGWFSVRTTREFAFPAASLAKVVPAPKSCTRNRVPASGNASTSS